MLGAILGTAATMGGSLFNKYQQDRANSQNWRNQQTMFTESAQMANSSHQREVKDLQAAGLNPILSAGGGGSQTPGGGSSSMQAPQIDMPGILQATQFQQQLDQGQQKIDIEKANSAAGIAKNLTTAQLERAQTLAIKGGIGTKFTGTDAYEKLKDIPLKGLVPSMPKSTSTPQSWDKARKSHPLFNQQPMQTSSGGNLP